MQTLPQGSLALQDANGERKTSLAQMRKSCPLEWRLLARSAWRDEQEAANILSEKSTGKSQVRPSGKPGFLRRPVVKWTCRSGSRPSGQAAKSMAEKFARNGLAGGAPLRRRAVENGGPAIRGSGRFGETS
jgi:hypothetical protein